MQKLKVMGMGWGGAKNCHYMMSHLHQNCCHFATTGMVALTMVEMLYQLAG